jgi:signal recognition particle subunit SRP54
MQKIGGMSGMLGLLPGIGKMKKQIKGANLDDKVFKRQGAIISSMTREERRNPKLLNASRKKRVATGSGTEVQEINRLLKMHRQMADMMKALGRRKGGLAGLFGGGMPAMPDMAEVPKGMDALPPPGPSPKLPGLPGLPGSGAPGGLPGLGGMPKFPFKKK